MTSYSLQSFVANDKIYYELTSFRGSILQLIQELEKDDLSFIDQYKNDKFNKLVKDCSQSIKNYCKLNKKNLTQDIHQISYTITLFSLVLCYEQHIENYTYNQLKDKLQIIIDIDIHDLIHDYSIEDWFRISTPIKKDYLLSEDKYLEIKQRKDISFVTYTNSGYLNYTKNLILSLEKCNFP